MINVSLASFELQGSTSFKTVKFHQTQSAKIMLVAVVSFAGLMIVTGLGNKFDSIEVLRFIFISAIIFSVIGSFAFLEEPIGTNSPVGLIMKTDRSGQPIGIWTISIGGSITEIPSSQEETQEKRLMQAKYAIEIPLYVVIFGIIGGYLRYLYSKALPILKNGSQSSAEEEKNKTDKKPERLHSFYVSLGEIALLFLAPVLAIAIYFMLNIIGISGTNSVYVIGVLSIAIGLVTKEAIDVIIRFAKSKFDETQDKINKIKNDQKKIGETTESD